MADLRFGSVCSGIEAASVAWEPLGFKPAWFAEIEAFPNAVLAHHWPAVPNLGDITSDSFIERAGACGPIDVLVGGTPCQGFSHAGRREGIRDPRSALATRFVEAARTLQPEWVVWENVPGCLTTAGGRDFGAFVGQVADCGYRWAYRVCDAQFFGVPQRRRRVFLVGHLGAGRPENVLFEPEGEGQHHAASSQAQPGFAGTAATGFGCVIPIDMRQASRGATMTNNRAAGSSGGAPGTGIGKAGDPSPCLSQSHPPAVAMAVGYIVHGEHSTAMRGNGNAQVAFQTERARCLDTTGGFATNQGGTLVLAYGISSDAVDRSGEGDGSAGQRSGLGIVEDLSPTLRARPSNSVADVARGVVRRLTPRECERLQGFPDDHTLVTYRKKPAKDGPRYKALGNSIAVPVLRWIGSRLLEESNTARASEQVA